MTTETFQWLVAGGLAALFCGSSIVIGMTFFLVFSSLNETARNMRAVSGDLRAAVASLEKIVALRQ